MLCTFTIDDNYHDDAIVKMPHIIAFIVVTTAAIADATAAIIVFVVSVKKFHLLITFFDINHILANTFTTTLTPTTTTNLSFHSFC